ncbi:MAG: Mfa1 family fimbria major subunit [Candidatus Symbiothrix sp.]|jgi:hypothetical protein|nr:Mfa1 family fimbria major subunit [Candidatus Symbiothrix sp.]
MKKNVWGWLFALIFSISFVACSDHDDDGNDDLKKGNTYLGIKIAFPQEGQKIGGLRSDPTDYNPVGTFTGRTWLNTVDVYVLSADGVTLTGSQRYTADQIVYSLDPNGSAVVEPKEPFLTTAGDKVIYVIINNSRPLLTAMPTATDTMSIVGSGIADLASVVQNLDLVVMTGKSAVTNIAAGVSADDVKAGQNHVKLSAVRVASRAIVTTTAPTNVTTKAGVTIGTISNITYSVAQGGNGVYYIQDTTTYKTWGYDYISGSDYLTTATQYYDYSDLLNTTDAVPANPATASDPRAFLNLNGKFLLENTHLSGDPSTTGYRKGNTAYVLVRAIFTPATSAITDGGELTNGTFYVGETDNRIYSTTAAAQNASGGGTNPQDVRTYQGGKVLYYIWLNPDVITKPYNSPVIRNNIYHININSFQTFGFNWNPLNPGPDNPDPKPANPLEPPTTPILPNDPLSLDETYMTVDITVLDWTVHSFGIDL